jgi:hypothetical protein
LLFSLGSSHKEDIARIAPIEQPPLRGMLPQPVSRGVTLPILRPTIPLKLMNRLAK